MTKEEYNFWLADINNIGIKKIELLLRIFGSAEAVFCASKEEIETFRRDCCPAELRFSDADVTNVCNGRIPEKIEEKYERLIKNGICFISKEDESYPSKLRNIYDAPFALYIKGKLPKEGEKLLAVVGARECTAYGKEMARYLTGAVAKEGISVISGLARGIDSYAHEGALNNGGITYGVLGCGIDICYPRENLKLYMDMQKDGGIISEYAPGIQPIAGNFPMRNRIISGLADAVLIIEARAKSGSLITADSGLEQGRDIYALPGKATDALSEGCNNLIKMGAKLVTSPKDILEDFIPGYTENTDQSCKGGHNLSLQQESIHTCMSADPKHIEEIALLTKQPVEQLMEQLLALELRGLIKQAAKNYYCKVL